jgi:hypothetical protein
MWEEIMLPWETSYSRSFVLRYDEEEEDYEGGFDEDFEEDEELEEEEEDLDEEDEDLEDDYEEYDDLEDEFDDEEPKPGRKRTGEWD